MQCTKRNKTNQKLRYGLRPENPPELQQIIYVQIWIWSGKLSLFYNHWAFKEVISQCAVKSLLLKYNLLISNAGQGGNGCFLGLIDIHRGSQDIHLMLIDGLQVQSYKGEYVGADTYLYYQ